MKKRLSGFLCVSLVLSVVCLWSGIAAAKEKTEGAGKTVIIIHSDDDVDVLYHRQKIGSLAGGGLLVYAIGTIAATPAAKDAEKRNELNRVISGWKATDVFKASFAGNLNKDYEVIVIHDNKKFDKVDREFYAHGSSRYAKDSPVYDFTPLKKDGINTVIDVQLSGSLIFGGGGKMRPVFVATARYLDLDSKTATADKRAAEAAKGKGSAKKFEEFLDDGGSVVKTNLTELADKVGKKLALKIK